MIDLRMLNRYRDRLGERAVYGAANEPREGAFVIPSPIDQQPLIIVASTGEDWDHVSVSRKNRCPNWIEMEHVKRLFFAADETAMQLHVPASEHISHHPYCLHLWRPQRVEIPRPPGRFVA